MSDADFVMVKYMHPSMGGHGVYGSPGPDGKRVFYGYRKRGDEFLVSVADQKAFPHWFHPLPSKPEPPKVRVEAPPPPSLMVGAEARSAGKKDAPPSPIVNDAIDATRFDLQLLPGITPAMEKGLRGAGLTTPKAIIAAGQEGLEAIKFIGARRAELILSYVKDKYG